MTELPETGAGLTDHLLMGLWFSMFVAGLTMTVSGIKQLVPTGAPVTRSDD